MASSNQWFVRLGDDSHYGDPSASYVHPSYAASKPP